MWYKIAQKNKRLILTRGAPGSGKSTLSKSLAEGGAALSTDDFFIDPATGEYNYDPEQIGKAHAWNIDRAKKLMNQGMSPIVIDNTNTQAWEPKPYVEHGLKNGYEIEIHEPNTPWKNDAEELARRNSHGVPQEAIQKMLNQWEPDLTVEKILQSKSPYE